MTILHADELTKEIKKFCLANGADIVGVAPVERWCHAPIERSPIGLMTSAKAVIVMGFHYLDSCVELSENDDIRIPGAAVTNHIASDHATWLNWKLAKWIEKRGFSAVPIAPTLWWTYRASPDAPRGYASDLTHYYAAVAAGLGELGWSNICLTPEFGPRQRLISLVTDAPLTPDLMYSGEPLCDMCLQCAKRCPSKAFDKEVDGMITINYGERQFSFPNKNLWRCAAGENFNLDIFADWPDRIDEDVIDDFAERATTDTSLRYGWKMGLCLKYCVPKARRYYDRNYSPSPRRRRDVVPDTSADALASMMERIDAFTKEQSVNFLGIATAEMLKKSGISLSELPGAKSVLVLGHSYPPGSPDSGVRIAGSSPISSVRTVARNTLWLAKYLQNVYGFDCLVASGVDAGAVSGAIGFDAGDYAWQLRAIVTTIPFAETRIRYFEPEADVSGDLSRALREAAAAYGADLYGVAPVSRTDEIAAQLERVYSKEDYFVSYEQGWGPKAETPADMRGKPANPAIRDVPLIPKRAEDYVENARSVIVIGLGLIEGSIENAGKPPAYKAGHYSAYNHQESVFQNQEIALRLAKILHAKGYRAVITNDLEGLASNDAGTRQPDLKANRFAAVAAGLGELGKNGMVLTPGFGSKVRFAAVVTDAVLQGDDLYTAQRICTDCGGCVSSCPVQAISPGHELEIMCEGHVFSWGETDLLRCDWAARYGLVKAEGPGYAGSLNDFAPPAVITREILLDTIKAADRIQKEGYCPIVERCFTECPVHKQ